MDYPGNHRLTLRLDSVMVSQMQDGVTVLIPVYNGAQYLSECIESVLAQTLPASKIVVIDDGSEDETPNVARAWGMHVRYHRVEHGGLPYARNHGIRLVQSDVIAFIDSDDVWLPRKLELQMAALANTTEPTMVFGHVQQFVSKELKLEEAARLKCVTASIPGLLSSTLLIRKSDCERAGPFDEAIQTGEFIEWCSRAADTGIKTFVIPEIVCRRRLHRNNLGRGGIAVHANYLRMLKTIIDRRRQLK
jgi:glycosyltransferase involved in cell wall biosynthesis